MTDPDSYYGDPILHQPVWTAEIPWYFFTGGLAGASSVLAVVARVGGREEVARAWERTATVGAMVSPILLVADLGRPSRLLHMLRVFKPSSPMSMGSWLLAIYAPAAIGATVLDRLAGSPAAAGLARAGRVVAGLTGPGLVTYTAVLLADTAVPFWHDAGRQLPFVFAGSALASAGGAGVILTPASGAAPARRALALGVVLELVADRLMEHDVGDHASAAYRQAPARAYHRWARALSGGGVVTTLTVGRTRRRWATIGGALTMAGSLCERFAVFKAGFASAADPAASVGPQRERRERQLPGAGSAGGAATFE